MVVGGQQAADAMAKKKGDFWGKASDWWGGITGKNQKQAGQTQMQAGLGQMGQAGATAGGIAGVTEAQQMQNAQAASSGLAEQQGQIAAKQGTRAALQGARTSGLNAGQAALASGQQAGDIYTNQYQQGLQGGMNQYGQATGQRLAAAGTQGALGQGQAQIGLGQQQAGQQQNQQFWGGVSGLASAGLGLLSDREAKIDIKDAETIDEASETIDPKRFRYKSGGGEHVGVIAQDVEKVLPENVRDTPAGKVIDVAKQVGSNSAMLMETIRRLRSLERKVAGNG